MRLLFVRLGSIAWRRLFCLFFPLQLVLWESYDLNASLAGGMRYQPKVIKPDLVEAFGEEFCRLLHVVSRNPSASLLELARQIRPPFLSSRSRTKGRRGLNQKL